MIRSVLACMIWLILAVSVRAGEQFISGVVNTYHKVTGIDAKGCRQFVAVESVSGLSAGDLILIIQMKGATVTTPPTDDFGTVVDMGSCGHYEFARIEYISSNVLTLRYTLFNTYDVAGAVQLVRVPRYDDAIVIAPLNALPWNGSTGGVIAIDVAGTLQLRSDIDASGMGFRNDAMWDGDEYMNGSSCSIMDFALARLSRIGAMKGSGIADAPVGMEAGRGRLANAGGGGNSHNAGGGGGGNGGTGGRGGNQYVECDQRDINGGIGGQSLDYLAGIRMILGGAGGSGQQNDDLGAPGAPGGGIVIVRTNRMDASHGIIASNGSDAAPAVNDGGGGGGAGGSIHLQVQEWLTPVTIMAAGGRGSDLSYVNAHGPGGGGGGGAVVLSTIPLTDMTIKTDGGINGHNLQLIGSEQYDHHAQPGTGGIVLTGESISEHTLDDTFRSGLPNDTTVCEGTTVVLSGRPRRGMRPYSVIWRRLPDNAVVSDDVTLSVSPTGTERFVYMATDANGCVITDTVTIFVNSSFTVPDTVDVGLLVPCATETKDVTFDIVPLGDPAQRGTITAVETTGPISTTLAAGDDFEGTHPVRVTIQSQADGPIHGTIRLRLAPCDAEYIVHIVGEQRTATFDGDRALTFAPQIGGGEEVRQATYYNNGTTNLHVDRIEPPTAPFTIVSTSPALPCDLAPGDTLVVSIRGSGERSGTFVDSCRILVSAPCPIVVSTRLSMQIDTHMVVRIPHLTGQAGQRIDVPLLLDTPMAVDPGSQGLRYRALVRWQHDVLRPIGFSSGDDQWTTNIDGDLIAVNIMGKWSGGDTLAIIPALILLSPLDTIPLDLDDERPFAWAGFRATIEQHDGSLGITDVCTGAIRRTVTFRNTISGIKVHPMPMNDDLHVTIEAPTPQTVSLSLVDITGRIVASTAGNTTAPIRLDTSTLGTGSYILHVTTQHERHDIQIMKYP